MNVGYSFTSNVILAFELNSSAISAASNSLNWWTDSSQEKGNAWLHGNDQTPHTSDPAHNAQDFVNWLLTQVNSGTNDPLSKFFSQQGQGGYPWYFGSVMPIQDWCMDMITTMQTAIATAKWDTNLSGTWNSMIGQQSSLVQAQQGLDTSTADAEAKACQSTLGSMGSAGSVCSSAGDAVTGVFSSGSSAQAMVAG